MTERQIQAAMDAAGMKFQRVAKNGTLWSDGVSIVMVRAPGAWPYHVQRNFEGDLKRAIRKRESMQPASSPIAIPQREPQRKVIRAGKVATIGDMIAADAEVFKQAKSLAPPAPKLMSDPQHRDDALLKAMSMHSNGAGWLAISAVLNGEGYRRADGSPLKPQGLARQAQLAGLHVGITKKDPFKPTEEERSATAIEVPSTLEDPAPMPTLVAPTPPPAPLPPAPPIGNADRDSLLAILRNPSLPDTKKIRILLALLED